MPVVYFLSEVTAMEGLISNITSLVTAAIGWISSYVTSIAGSPLLLIFVITPFVGLGIGLIRRIIHS